ncbi:MAG TPA: hypothetical protein VFC92_00630 [Bacteroidales bacterium]|nr:hypothetical protein [Bacteroidales bacterium]
MEFNLPTPNLLEANTNAVKESPLEKIARIKKSLDFLLMTVSGIETGAKKNYKLRLEFCKFANQ